MNRREFIASSAALGCLGSAAWAEQESPLIYLSPLRSDGNLSRCQAEVWYVTHGSDMYVVTDQAAWRSRAVDQGLTQTQIWVGDVGLWEKSDGRYKSLPSLQAEASKITNSNLQDMLLGRFGAKYASEWRTWGPRFERGLASGSRVLLRYKPV